MIKTLKEVFLNKPLPEFEYGEAYVTFERGMEHYIQIQQADNTLKWAKLNHRTVFVINYKYKPGNVAIPEIRHMIINEFNNIVGNIFFNDWESDWILHYPGGYIEVDLDQMFMVVESLRNDDWKPRW